MRICHASSPSTKAMTEDTRVSGRTTTQSTLSLAHSSISRRGTTDIEIRIMPLPYSPVNMRIPSTPSTSWVIRAPNSICCATWYGGSCFGRSAVDLKNDAG